MSAILNGSVYVAKDGNVLNLLYFAPDNAVLVSYQPLTNKLQATVLNLTFAVELDVLMDGMLEQNIVDAYYETDATAVVEMMVKIIELLQEE